MKSFKNYKTTSLVILILVLAALFEPLSSWLEATLRNNNVPIKALSYLRIFSTLGLILITLTLINHFGWKWRIFNWLINIPDLNGRYEGTLISSFTDEDGNRIEKDCAIEINQIGSNINIFSYYGDLDEENQTSMSYSISEIITKDEDNFSKVYYIFANQADTLEKQLNNHDGTAKLKYYPDIDTLEGEYYNKRQNIGTIKVSYSQDNLIGRLVP